MLGRELFKQRGEAVQALRPRGNFSQGLQEPCGLVDGAAMSAAKIRARSPSVWAPAQRQGPTGQGVADAFFDERGQAKGLGAAGPILGIVGAGDGVRAQHRVEIASGGLDEARRMEGVPSVGGFVGDDEAARVAATT